MNNFRDMVWKIAKPLSKQENLSRRLEVSNEFIIDCGGLLLDLEELVCKLVLDQSIEKLYDLQCYLSKEARILSVRQRICLTSFLLVIDKISIFEASELLASFLLNDEPLSKIEEKFIEYAVLVDEDYREGFILKYDIDVKNNLLKRARDILDQVCDE